MNKTAKYIVYKLLMIAANLGLLIVACIFLRELPKYITVIAIILFATLGTVYACLNNERFQILSKLLIVGSILAGLVLVGYLILDRTGLLAKFTDFNTIKQFILNTKQWGILVFLLLTVFQVVLLPIPSAVTILIGVAIYGPLVAFILSTIGTIIGSLIAFSLGKVFGKKLVTWMVGEEKTEKYADIVGNKGRFLFIMMLLFPGFPDDMLCLVAGITSMSYKYFLIVVCITRPIMIAFTSFFGSGEIIPFRGWGIPIWIAIFCAAIVLFLLMNRLKNHLMAKRAGEPLKRPKEKPLKTKPAKHKHL